MNAIGKVIEVKNDIALVETLRSSACASCNDCEAKGACHAELIFGNDSDIVVSMAQNHVGAKVGDRVEMSTSTGKTLFVSFVLFVIPVLISVLVYLSVSAFASDIVAAVLLIASFFVSFIILMKIMDLFVKNKVTIRIVKILEERE